MIEAFEKDDPSSSKNSCSRCRKDGHWESKSFKRENNTLTNGSSTNDNKPSSSSSRKPAQNKNLNSRAEGQSQNLCSF